VWDLIDLFVIIAVLISVFSFIFVAIEIGTKVVIGYRESEETQRKKKQIDETLLAETRKQAKHFTNNLLKSSKQEFLEEELDKIEEIGFISYICRSITKNMLEAYSSYSKDAFKCLAIGAFYLFFAVILGAYFWETNLATSILFIIMLSIPAAIFFFLMYKNIQKGLFIREKFNSLYENSTIQYCQELTDELVDKGLW
jgi:hypothetical protein